ncbi:MAG TPA: glycosyltransferase [Steroidobacteraceae bacterium]|nr:glycosyltransferase [Steroidobacteraceae bacterium]
MLLLEVLIGAAALAILIPILILSAEVLAASLSRDGQPQDMAARPRLGVVIPAHNEASGIGDALDCLIPQLQNGDRLLVVADNCTDDTATIASAAGAEVIERNDSSHRGKGYALDLGMRHLAADPPAVVLIVDADCRVEEGSIDRLARVCAQTGRPVQALYLSHAPPGARLAMRVAEFAFVLKNRVRPLGLRSLGLPCQLMGTGMAFPWACIAKATLATGHIVEDLKLGLELAGAGYPPLFCPEAQVTSSFPASHEGFESQRTRWEHGYLTVLVKDAPAVLLKSVHTLNRDLLALGLDVCVPPVALLTLLAAAVWIASAIFRAVTRVDLPLLIASAAVALLTLSVLSAWTRYGRQILSPGSLALAIAYALLKIPLYFRFLVARQFEWVRTKRDEDRPR